MSNIYERFAAAASRGEGRTAIEVQRRKSLESFDYGQVRTMAERAAATLVSNGLADGDRCALIGENDANWVAAFLGTVRCGAVAVPLDTSYVPAQIARLLDDCDARMIIASPRSMEAVVRAAEISGRPRTVLCLHPVDDVPAGSIALFGDAAVTDVAQVEKDAAAVILYTSGTTSDPKGVVLSHGNLHAEIDAVFQVITLDGTDVVLSVLPLFHALALIANLWLPLSNGSRVVFLESLDTAQLVRALQQRGITAFCCVPQFFYLIHQRILEKVSTAGLARRTMFRTLLALVGGLRERTGINLGPRVFGKVHAALGPKMRLLVTGGSRFDPRIGRDLYRLGFNLLQAYGLTETTGGASVLRPNDPHIESVGQPLPGAEVRIGPVDLGVDVAPATRGSDGRTHEIGEILIRGPMVSRGYHDRPDVNAETFRDGWLHSGDLGYLDAEGRIHVTGRAKEMIVLGSGKNIYPEEIESHYAQSPFVKELCVLGLVRPGEPSAERLHAVVVPDLELMREKNILNVREILRFEIEGLSADLPGHKRILGYDIWTEELPRTTTRKLKRFEIERRLLDESAAGRSDVSGAEEGAEHPGGEEDTGWSNSPGVEPLLAMIREATREPTRVTPGASLELDLGLDSMERVELFAAMQARLDVRIPDETTHGIYTVRELVDALVDAADGNVEATEDEAEVWGRLLQEEPGDREALDSLRQSRPFATFAIFIGLRIIGVLARVFLGFRVTGRDRIPEKGPFLLCPNHQSFLDGFLLAAALPTRTAREMFFVGASEHFATPSRARFARGIRLVPVDPDTQLLRAMQAGAEGLRSGMVLVLFPEGERSIDGEIKTFKKGAAILAAHASAPVVPVALDGAFEFWPRGRGIRWSSMLPFSGRRIRLTFGEPLDPPAGEAADYAAMTDRLRARVIELKKSLSPGG